MHTLETRKRAWEKMKVKRIIWLQANGPCIECGSWKDLEVDHIDPAIKFDHRVWSWSENRRKDELSKCQVLCKICHQEKSKLDIAKMRTGELGELNHNARLTNFQALSIRSMYNTGQFSQRKLAELFNVTHVTINKIVRCKSYNF